VVKLTEITRIIRNSAVNWANKIGSSQQPVLNELTTRSKKQKASHNVCPCQDCDHGQITSRRHAMVAPCIHVTWQSDGHVESSAPNNLNLGDSQPPQIDISMYQGAWSKAKQSQDVAQGNGPSFEGEFENPDSPEGVDGFLAQIRYKLCDMHPGRKFPYSHDQIAYQLGKIQARLEERMQNVPRHVRETVAR
jgi:hypothetical protein